MNNLNNTLLVENLKKKVNIGVIPQIDPITQYILQPVAINSYFAIGRFEADGHILDYQLHIMLMDRPNIPKVINYNVSITDETTGEFYADDQIFPREICQVEIEGNGENAKQIIRVPNGCMIGNCNEMHWEGTMPNGKIAMNMVGYGYAVFNGGSGNFNSCLRGQDFNQFSLPNMKSTGALTLNDKTYNVSGKSWVDRQWQGEDVETDLVSAIWNWTWLDLNLDNGDVISLWEMNNITCDFTNAWATVMHPNGTQSTCQMELLVNTASEYWRSPITNQNYPTRWRIRIPDLDTDLDVKAAVKESEIVSQIPFLNKYEGACLVDGTYHGKPMKGFCYAEMLGDWSDER